MMSKKAKWIVVTGLDGSGKTTLVDNLVTWFQEKGYKVMRDRFPHDRYLVKDLLNKSHDRYTDRLLFALDNRLFGTELQERIDSGEYDVIITQRGFLDSFVLVDSWAEPNCRSAKMRRYVAYGMWSQNCICQDL